MAVIGMPLLAVLFLHATTFEVGALAAAAYLPWLAIGLPAGAWVDRRPPRPVMIALRCGLGRAVCQRAGHRQSFGNRGQHDDEDGDEGLAAAAPSRQAD